MRPFNEPENVGQILRVRNSTEEEMTKAEPAKHSTIPFDPRFPNINQTKNCYQNYLDFHRCAKKRGEDFETCQYFKRAYKILCPRFWVEKWDNQIEEGTFAGTID